MTYVTVEEEGIVANPLDLIEELVVANDWPFQRAGDDEIVCEIGGRWGQYRLYFIWQEHYGALQFCCRMETRAPKRRAEINGLLAAINSRLWLGHFDVAPEDAMPTFRHTTLLRGTPAASPEQIEDLVEAALIECERYYPAFQLVIWGGKSAEEALEAAVIETVGEA